MAKIILCRGIQGSGKSTWAKAWADEDPEHRVRYNNDDIRCMLGKYWVPSREHIVSRVKMAVITEAMEAGYDIVIDNMNLNPKEEQYYLGLIDEFNTRRPTKEYHLEYQDFHTDLEECIRRDSLRPQPVGEEVIRATFERYKLFYESQRA